MTHPVFFDPSGLRRRVINHATLVLGVSTGLLAVLFIVSLLAAPFVQRPGVAAQADRLRARTAGSLLAPRRARVSRHLVLQARAELAREIAATRPGPGRAAARMTDDSMVAAFYVVWQGQNGINDLRQHADRLTHVIPEWLHLSRDGAGIDLRDYDTVVVRGNAEVVRIAHEHGIDILPIINNAEDRAFDPRRAALMLGSPVRRRAVAVAVRDFVVRHGFDGVNVDFENLAAADYEKLPAFVAELKAALPDSLSVSVDIEAGLPTALVGRLAQVADFVVLMAYAQHGPANEPGPLAALPWFDGVLARVKPVIPPGKLVAGIGNYGIDWTRGASGAATTVVGAWVTARDRRTDRLPQDVVDFDAAALNPTFVYRDDSTRAHEVWFLDAVTAYNQLRLAQRHGAAGAALWVLGAEDPSLWTLFDRHLKGSLPPPGRLDSIGAPGSVNYIGDGEILSIAGTPAAGTRQTDLDSATGLLTDERYLSFPASFVIKREGYRKGLLALTFDDGPDDRWTDEVLDTLDALGVKATFFVVGQNVEKYPDVVRRILAAGHEVGNHTFTHPNMATVRRRQAVLELNATQRAIEAVTGRSTILFRVPYNTDAEPQHGGETTPLTIASDLGYVTVGELLDPMDWSLYASTGDPSGQLVRRTPRQLADEIVRLARTVRGNVVLLHSAGGDRSLTVRALPLAIPELEAGGYRFVTVSQLLGVSRDAVMPPVSAREQVLVGSDRITFEILDLGESFLTSSFVAALILAVLRLLFVVPLALAARRRTGRTPAPVGTPSVSVLIAAFNEAPVIERTIRSILASAYPDQEVIVVDDGSTDGTGDIVAAAFADDPRVRLLVQANAGKAGALNKAIAESRHEVLVCFDADTVAEPDTIALLARHFSDPLLAAVAGNVKVGNRINTLTIWQSIEYITSQNLDRRAYASLNAVTVVPGAVGAWRRSAVLKIGGYVPDTLAEDMDLTMRLRRAGWRIDAEAASVAWTEAPETWEPFLRQRYRWAYGSLQVLWKHRGALGRFGWFGRLVLPAQWLFGVIFQILGPLVDLRLLYAILAVALSAINGAAQHLDWQPQLTHLLMQTGFFYAVFFAVDLAASLVAFRLDREDLKQLWWLFWQRFVYRQTMYYVLWKAVVGAAKGKRFGWGKGLRTGSLDPQRI
jgi:cellulose synthase/poly-beta-1,6-N-acetylglucosamine synthase-like glycosyltransferase/peptidoglycan/xylan/chitin deacetylase (PgdA/CDA1 family)/spore germination protein YaaH